MKLILLMYHFVVSLFNLTDVIMLFLFIFQSLLGMNKTEFYALPAWKQANLKKNASLF